MPVRALPGGHRERMIYSVLCFDMPCCQDVFSVMFKQLSPFFVYCVAFPAVSFSVGLDPRAPFADTCWLLCACSLCRAGSLLLCWRDCCCRLADRCRRWAAWNVSHCASLGGSLARSPRCQLNHPSSLHGRRLAWLPPRLHVRATYASPQSGNALTTVGNMEVEPDNLEPSRFHACLPHCLAACMPGHGWPGPICRF